jgi:hypothetical protein
MHVYEVRPRKDKCGVDLIPDAPAFGRLWYGEPDASQQCNRVREASQPSKKSGQPPDGTAHTHETAIRMLISNKPDKKKSTLAATFSGRSHDAVIRVYDAAGNVIETHEHAGEFREP